MIIWQRAMCVFAISVAVAACSTGPQVTTTQKFAESTSAPYENLLVIFLADKFDSRRYLETEVVKKLAENGTQAVASTSMMDSRTPKTRQTFLAMVEKTGADAVLVTQIANLQSEGTVVDMNPEATYNFRPTYYYNVWSVDLQEYKEPQAVDFEHSLALATQLYSVSSKDVVWAIESHSNIKQAFDQGPDYSIYVDEAKAIASSLRKDGLISK
jgi:hypothetical protein